MESVQKRVRTGASPWPEVAAILAEVSRAVEAAHADGRVGLGLTPRSVVGDVGELRLASINHHPFGVEVVRYTAPEVGDGDLPDERSDRYSLGMLASALLVGERTLVNEGLASLEAIEIPEALRTIIALCTATDPAARTLSPAQLTEACEALAAGKSVDVRFEPSAEVSPPPDTPLPKTVTRRPRRWRVARVAAAIAASLLLAGSAFVVAGWIATSPAAEADEGVVVAVAEVGEERTGVASTSIPVEVLGDVADALERAEGPSPDSVEPAADLDEDPARPDEGNETVIIVLSKTVADAVSAAVGEEVEIDLLANDSVPDDARVEVDESALPPGLDHRDGVVAGTIVECGETVVAYVVEASGQRSESTVTIDVGC